MENPAPIGGWRRLLDAVSTCWRDYRRGILLAGGLAALVLILIAGVFLSRVPGAGQRSPSPRASASIRVPANLPGSPDEMAQAGAIAPVVPEEEARALNEHIAFVANRGPSALPFRFSGDEMDRDRARNCLAAAALYEAGAGDGEGQRAVMQVVLNRVRHPAYPHSICGVVFQGAERNTGCQFTFSCDGSLHRRYSDVAWTDARARAERFLVGDVYAGIGLATHYHTDWVHPYWSSSLDKLTRVRTHLFFRWKGYWGTRGAFNGRYLGHEPRIGMLGAFIPSHADGEGQGDVGTGLASLPGAVTDPEIRALPPPRSAIAPAALGIAPTALAGAQVMFVHPQGGAYLVAIPSSMNKARFATFAASLCGQAHFCKVQAWTDMASVPRGYPVPPDARNRIRFQYIRENLDSSAEITG